MIKPIVGGRVWVWRAHPLDRTQPEAGIIVGVNSDISINVVGWSQRAYPFHFFDLLLHQAEMGDEIPPLPYAEWMPCQTERPVGHGG